MAAGRGLFEEILAFAREPAGNIGIAPMNRRIAEALGSGADRAILSADTLSKQRANHPDLLPEDYLLLPLILADPMLILLQDERRVVLMRPARKPVRVAIKVTHDRREAFIVSFHFIDPSTARRFARNSTILHGRIEQIRE